MVLTDKKMQYRCRFLEDLLWPYESDKYEQRLERRFLFVGNQLALDFVNTRLARGGQTEELLPDGPSLVRWLAAAGLVTRAGCSRLQRHWSGVQNVSVIQELLSLREDLRKTVSQIEMGKAATPGFIQRLNFLLLQHPRADEVVMGPSGWERRQRFVPELPQDALKPISSAIMSLLTETPSSRVRKCKSCMVHFYDTSKKGTRQWCSMDLCGNRSKVAAYAQRKRAAQGDLERKFPPLGPRRSSQY